jgi:hypothetical protein
MTPNTFVSNTARTSSRDTTPNVVRLGNLLKRPSGVARMRDGRVVHEYVETAELLPDAFLGGGDRGLIRDVGLEGADIRSDAFRGRLPVLKVARPDEHDEALCREALCDLKTDSFSSPGYQGDRFVLHGNLLFCILHARALRRRSGANAAHF